MKNKRRLFFLTVLITASLFGCKSGPFNLIKPATPHEQYERKLVNAGLHQTAMGTAWLNNAQQSLQNALSIQIPYQEKGYFAADKVDAAAFKFKLTRGEKLHVKLDKKPASGFMIYLDVWEQTENNGYKLVVAADTLGNTTTLEAERTGDYILRLQPELLGSGEFTLSITKGPSLGYPLKSVNRNQIQSFYGAGRDENTRRHEGVDIFAPFRTPVLAVAPGTVTGVNTNNLGGNVVWFRPEGKNFTVYYAHLDGQSVTEGQQVMPGDTLGRMGNTGNAKTTAPHLHLGIYTNNGAIDPLPFIDPVIREIPKINTSTTMLNSTMRTVGSVAVNGEAIKSGTVIRVTAATGNAYRVQFPDGNIGYITSKSLVSTTKALSTVKLKTDQEVFDRPDELAAVKLQLKTGQTVSVLGDFGEYQLMRDEDQQTGWIRK